MTAVSDFRGERFDGSASWLPIRTFSFYQSNRPARFGGSRFLWFRPEQKCGTNANGVAALIAKIPFDVAAGEVNLIERCTAMQDALLDGARNGLDCDEPESAMHAGCMRGSKSGAAWRDVRGERAHTRRPIGTRNRACPASTWAALGNGTGPDDDG